MLVNILIDFDEGPVRYFKGANPDVDPQVARRWIADGKAAADADGAQNPTAGTSTTLGPFASVAALNAAAPPAANAGKSAYVSGTNTFYDCDGSTWFVRGSRGLLGNPVSFSSTASVSNGPALLTRLRVVSGSGLSVVVYDNPGAASGNIVFSGTALSSASADIVFGSSGYQLINGAYVVLTGTGTVEAYLA